MIDFAQGTLDGAYRLLGVAALYRAGGVGAGTPVTVMPKTADDVGSPFEARRSVETVIYEIRRTEVAQPAKGDTVDLLDAAGDPLGAALRVNGFHRKDARRLVWQLELEEVPA